MIPIKKRWKMISPHLEHIKYGSSIRPILTTAKEFYGFDDINEKNYKLLSKSISASNTPGIYRRILRDKCNIRIALTQMQRTDYDFDFLVPISHILIYTGVGAGYPLSKEIIEKNAADLGEKVKSLDNYLEVIRKGLEKWKSEGVVGIKTGQAS